MTKKTIIWLDDHFNEKFYATLLKRFVDPISSLANVLECVSMEEFHKKLLDYEERPNDVDGFIIDVMLKKYGENNFSLFGDSDQTFDPPNAGIRIVEILRGIRPSVSNIGTEKFSQTPILILTNEYADPISHYETQHPDLVEYIKTDGNPVIDIQSKIINGDTETKVLQWLNIL